MKCIFLYNPNSGKGRLLNKLEYIKSRLNEKFDEVVIYPTKSRQDTIATACQAASLYDAIIFSGGDGTFNDVTCGIASCEKRPILGYIPSGTVNDIARNLKIPYNLKKALNVITKGEYVYHDVGKINDKYFMYVSAIGRFTSVSYRTTQRTKRLFGKVAYAFDGLKDILSSQLLNVKVETDKETVEMEVPLLLVLNSISVGGIPFNKNGHLNDGEFDIILAKNDFTKGLHNIIKLFILGRTKKKMTSYFQCIKSSHFKIYVDEHVDWCVDGEKGASGNVEITNLHNHLKIYVPMKKHKPKSKNIL